VATRSTPKPPAPRFSIAEWHGIPITSLTVEQRRELAARQFTAPGERNPLPCPFKPGTDCWKESGVCTVRLYGRDETTLDAVISDPVLRTMCPTRFEEDNVIIRWVGETILGCSEPQIIPQVPFLNPPLLEDGSAISDREVGKIDNILLVPHVEPLQWCALEIQSVYFSGEAMENEWALLRDYIGEGLPFPATSHRPDTRSSGPKRLMPQLQTKVPSLRRWGKKMAVVVDLGFFRALGMTTMRTVSDISNSDVVWFVLDFQESDEGHFKLIPYKPYPTTLETTIEGLTAGIPTSLRTFESRILYKRDRLTREGKIATNQQLTF
jgi:hypothetical protein